MTGRRIAEDAVPPLACLPGGDLDQVTRKASFLAAHPGVRVFPVSSAGAWQARIPEPDGETVITRYGLRQLLDKLDEIFPPPEGG